MSLYSILLAAVMTLMFGLPSCVPATSDDDDSAASDDDDATTSDDDDTTADDDDSATSDDDDSATSDDDDSATSDDDDDTSDDDDSATSDDDDDTSGPDPCATQILVGSGLELDLSFEDGSGSAAADASGHARNAVLHGNPTWAIGYCGGGLSFDGSDDWALVAGVLGAHTESSVTLEAWVFIPTAAPWSTNVPQILSGGTANNYRLSLNNHGAGRFFGRVETVDPATNSPTFGVIESAIYEPIPFPVVRWTHLALTYGPVSATDPDHIVRLFVNAVEQANQAVGNPTMPLLPAADLEIAGWNQIGNSFFEGLVDDVRVWSTVRAPDEICEDGRGSFEYATNTCLY